MKRGTLEDRISCTTHRLIERTCEDLGEGGNARLIFVVLGVELGSGGLDKASVGVLLPSSLEKELVEAIHKILLDAIISHRRSDAIGKRDRELKNTTREIRMDFKQLLTSIATPCGLWEKEVEGEGNEEVMVDGQKIFYSHQDRPKKLAHVIFDGRPRASKLNFLHPRHHLQSLQDECTTLGVYL